MENNINQMILTESGTQWMLSIGSWSCGYKQTSVFYELFALSPLKYFKANTLWAERTPISSLPSSIMIEALGYLQMKITFLDS